MTVEIEGQQEEEAEVVEVDALPLPILDKVQEEGDSIISF